MTKKKKGPGTVPAVPKPPKNARPSKASKKQNTSSNPSPQDKSDQAPEGDGTLANAGAVPTGHGGDNETPDENSSDKGSRKSELVLHASSNKFLLPLGPPDGNKAISKEVSFGSGGSSQNNRIDFPRIVLIKGRLPRICDSIEGALVRHDLGIFQRAERIVRVTETSLKSADGSDTTVLVVREITSDHLRERSMRYASFIKITGQAAKLADPELLYFTALRDRGTWRFRQLNGIIQAPSLRFDGSILDQPGYDRATGLFFEPRDATFPRVRISPSRGDALECLARIKSQVATFPFISDADRSVWLSGFVTSVVRRTLPTSPMFAFNAPSWGSGKSMLVDMISVGATGSNAPVIAPGPSEEEFGKNLYSQLISGLTTVSIDNIIEPLESVILCQMLTQQRLSVRLFHTQKIVAVPTNVLVTATGNNLILVGDLNRRTLTATIDPGCERPERREFDFNPVAHMIENRCQLVVDALTILRAYISAGRPQQSTPLGGFEDWSRLIRDALIWLGEADPVATMDRAHSEDPVIKVLRNVMVAWDTIIGKKAVTAADAVSAMDVQDNKTDEWADLTRQVRENFMEGLGKMSSLKLGKYLSKYKGKIQDNRRFVQAGERGGSSLWRLEQV